MFSDAAYGLPYLNNIYIVINGQHTITTSNNTIIFINLTYNAIYN
jgi:hypothetical protein